MNSNRLLIDPCYLRLTFIDAIRLKSKLLEWWAFCGEGVRLRFSPSQMLCRCEKKRHLVPACCGASYHFSAPLGQDRRKMQILINSRMNFKT